MGLGEMLGAALVEFGVNRAGGAALDGVKVRRERALERRRDWVEIYLGKLMRRAAELERRVEALEDGGRQIGENLEDPDFWTTFENAAAAAARTGDPLKHELLSRLVLERLAAAPESTLALASTRAVEIVPHLSPHHLSALGLASLAYVVRPELPPIESREPKEGEGGQAANRRVQGSMAAQAGAFLQWLESALVALPLPEEAPSQVSTAHLVSVSALIFDRAVSRDVAQALAPWRDREDGLFVSMAASGPLSSWVRTNPTGRAFGTLWDEWLQHVTLTPAGLLVGASVCDFRLDLKTSLDLDASTYPTAGLVTRGAIWDGERFERKFMEALEREVSDLAHRDVGIWRRILKDR